MIRLNTRLAAVALLTCAVALPSQAESSITSSASDSLSRSSGSISDSITGSSHASSPDNKQVKGDYKVIDMAEVDGRPDMVQLRLQPVVASAETPERAAQPAATAAVDQLLLTLPREAAESGHIARNGVVTAMQRPYGIEFASGQPHAAFFLALADDWVREMKMAPLSL